MPSQLSSQWLYHHSCTWAQFLDTLWKLMQFMHLIFFIFFFHIPNCKSCHKAIAVVTRRAHCFDDCCIYSLEQYLVQKLEKSQKVLSLMICLLLSSFLTKMDHVGVKKFTVIYIYIYICMYICMYR